MATMLELEKQALDLPDKQRALLAAHLLDSLPAILHEDDGGLAEAAIRDAEMDQNPEACMSMDAFKAAFGR